VTTASRILVLVLLPLAVATTGALAGPIAGGPQEAEERAGEADAAPTEAEPAEERPPTEGGDQARAGDEEADGSDDEAPGRGFRWKQFVSAARGLLTWELFGGRLTLRAGARLQVDGTVVGENDLFKETYGGIDNSLDFRRVRLFAKGTIDDHLRYKLSFDLGSDPGLKDAYIEGIDEGLRVFGYGIGEFRVGHFKEPFSLQRQMSSNDLVFLEWGLPVGSIVPGRNLGFMLHDNAHLGRMSWAVGLFSFGNREEDNQSSSTFSLTGRVTGLPVYRNDGRTLIHVGVSYSSREPLDSEVRYFSRPEARFFSILVDTGSIASQKMNLAGFEAAALKGPFSVQTEAVLSAVSSPELDDPRFWGAYAEVGWFLTGEVRPYKQSNGTFGRVHPGVKYVKGLPFSRKSGGAFEAALRLSHLDLDDGLVEGGKLTNLGVGFNWYVNPTSRVMFDFINARVEDSGAARILLVRYQYNPRF
jgi:phosphate-selective porin OprO/OprP